MAEERKERCETCKFWETEIVDCQGYGACRRFPPVNPEPEVLELGGVANPGTHPSTAYYDWCGEWKSAN